MNKYTAEQVEAEIANYAEEAFPREEIDLERVTEMLRDYATLLRERESAKAGVTAQIRATACDTYNEEMEGHGEPANPVAMRAALEAVAPMLASARVPDEKEDLDPVRLRREGRVATEWERGFNEGWNDCRETMLTAAPKPETDNT